MYDEHAATESTFQRGYIFKSMEKLTQAQKTVHFNLNWECSVYFFTLASMYLTLTQSHTDTPGNVYESTQEVQLFNFNKYVSIKRRPFVLFTCCLTSKVNKAKTFKQCVAVHNTY